MQIELFQSRRYLNTFNQTETSNQHPGKPKPRSYLRIGTEQACQTAKTAPHEYINDMTKAEGNTGWGIQIQIH